MLAKLIAVNLQCKVSLIFARNLIKFELQRLVGPNHLNDVSPSGFRSEACLQCTISRARSSFHFGCPVRRFCELCVIAHCYFSFTIFKLSLMVMSTESQESPCSVLLVLDSQTDEGSERNSALFGDGAGEIISFTLMGMGVCSQNNECAGFHGFQTIW